MVSFIRGVILIDLFCILNVWQKLMTATVVIPYGGKQVFESVENIIDSFDNFQTDPKSAVSTITGSTLT